MKELKIVTFNIWDLPLWFVKDRRNRIESVARYLAGSGADIVCVQESWDVYTRPMIYKIMQSAGYSHVSVNESWYIFGNSGLLTFSKFPIKSKNFTSFSRLSAQLTEFFAWRGILETIVETPSGLVRVLNIHLHMPAWFFDRRIRLLQLRNAFKAIDWKNEMPTVFAGDFNEHELLEQKDFSNLFTDHKFTYPPLEGDFQPTYRAENPFVSCTWINRRSDSKCFDYIFVSGMEKIGLKVKNYSPVYLNPTLSDHDPVVLTLTANT